jgi:hypothetical protein
VEELYHKITMLGDLECSINYDARVLVLAGAKARVPLLWCNGLSVLWAGSCWGVWISFCFSVCIFFLSFSCFGVLFVYFLYA